MAKSFDRTEKLLGSFSYFPGPIPERTELKINGLRAVLTAGYSNDDTIDVANYKWVTLEVTIANGKSVRISGLSDELKIKTVATTINYHALAEAMDEYSAKYRDAMGEN
jgi:hypothetical protein